MALDAAKIGELMVAVSTLKKAEILSVEEANRAYETIRVLSEQLAHRLQRTTRPGHRSSGAFLKNLPEDAAIRSFLPEKNLQKLSEKHGRLLMCLFENKDRICTFSELLKVGWDDENASKTLLGPRIQEIRDRIEPQMEIQSFENHGYQLIIKTQ